MTETADARILEGRKLTKGYAGWAAGAGLSPFPLLDVAGLMATQVALLRDLTRLYGVPFDRERARLVLSAVAGSLAPQGVAGLGGVSALKAVPVFGGLLGMVAMPVLAIGATMAVGEWFLQHLAAGGTLADAGPVDKPAGPATDQLEASVPRSRPDTDAVGETDVDLAAGRRAPAAKPGRTRRPARHLRADKGGDAG